LTPGRLPALAPVAALLYVCGVGAAATRATQVAEEMVVAFILSIVEIGKLE
jgi:hypothetical protein